MTANDYIIGVIFIAIVWWIAYRSINMSCSKWRWTEECDNRLCVGDCDLCEVEDDEQRSIGDIETIKDEDRRGL